MRFNLIFLLPLLTSALPSPSTSTITSLQIDNNETGNTHLNRLIPRKGGAGGGGGGRSRMYSGSSPGADTKTFVSPEEKCKKRSWFAKLIHKIGRIKSCDGFK